MSQINLNDLQKRLKNMAENVVLKDKIERRVILSDMTAINQQLSTEEQLQLVLAIDMAPALRFLSAAGIRGSARIALFARLADFERQMRR